MSEITIDARTLRMYPVAGPGFTGATEVYVRRMAYELAGVGHTVNLICPDLDRMQRRGPNLYYWGPNAYPSKSDVAILAHSMEFVRDHEADHYILMSNGTDPYCGPDGQWATVIDAFPCFSEKHVELLCKMTPTVDRAKCYVTGLGVDLANYPLNPTKVFGRMLFSNDPSRGLFHVLDIFDEVKKLVPEATLHVAYDFERQFQLRAWAHEALAQQMWECRERLRNTPGVVNLGVLSDQGIIAEQLDCQVHVHPSEPNNIGSQIHGQMQMECAAAGCALVLSDVEAFPEVFGEAADILPVPGTFFPDEGRVMARGWANVVAKLMNEPRLWQQSSQASRTLAEKHTWSATLEKWEGMLASLSREAVAA